uniref:Uncharacterized protein n=1 Tax=Arundo donax TaxID=35708 RepID=A0A0A9C633_ARUDO
MQISLREKAHQEQLGFEPN